jgi:adenylate kinase
MKLIFLGPPGAGKGTLAEKIKVVLNAPQISPGVIFRCAIEMATPLGLKVKAIIDEGKLVDNEITIELIKQRLSQEDARENFILDGFPRTIIQAEALTTFAIVDKVVNFDIPDSLVLERMGGREVCSKCGSNFHKVFCKPKVEGICDHCGGKVYTRGDDKIETIQKRLDIYRTETLPLISYYRDKGLLVDIDAQPSIDKVLENFKKALGL